MKGHRFDVEFVYEQGTEDNVRERLAQKVAKYMNRFQDCDPMLEVDSKVGREENSYASSKIDDWKKVSVRLFLSPKQVGDNFDGEKLKEDLEERFMEHQNFKRVQKRRVTAL